MHTHVFEHGFSFPFPQWLFELTKCGFLLKTEVTSLEPRTRGQRRSLRRVLALRRAAAGPVHRPELGQGRARPGAQRSPRLLPCRELLRCEAALARLYCRMALLNIFAPKLPHLFTRLFHIPAIRDITLEHLQLLSNQLLAPPLPGKARPRPCTREAPTQERVRPPAGVALSVVATVPPSTPSTWGVQAQRL